MKVTVNEQQPTKQEIKAGMLATNEFGLIALILEMYDDKFKGLVFSSPTPLVRVGNIYKSFVVENFYPFLGTITLSNDEPVNQVDVEADLSKLFITIVAANNGQ